jgi:plasmid stabilization system protein ParE
MARSVVWTDLAWQDLERVVDTIARDSPTYAAGFARRVWERAQSLDELSYRGRVVPELGDPEVRELILANYRLLYEIRGETVYLLGLIHGARDLPALWEREGESRKDDPGTPATH